MSNSGDFGYRSGSAECGYHRQRHDRGDSRLHGARTNHRRRFGLWQSRLIFAGLLPVRDVGWSHAVCRRELRSTVRATSATDPPRVRNFVNNCPAALDEIVHKLLAKNPDDRPFNARHVQAVMLQLGETKIAEFEGPSASVIQPDGGRPEVGGDDVATRGRAILRKQIESRRAGAAAAEPAGKLAVMLAAIVGVIAVAAMRRG